MTFSCPYCEHRIHLKDAKPGRFSAHCPKCAKKFRVIVSDDPATPPQVISLEAERTRVAATVTSPPPSEPALPETIPDSPAIQDDPNRTEILPRTEPPGLSDPNATAPLPPTQPATAATNDDDSLAFNPPARPRIRPSDVPSTLGGYHVIEELGRGGMGAVYLARQISLNRNVALKVMKPEWASDAAFVARFTREAYAAAQLTHHNVVQIYDFGEDRGTPYFSMEFVEGKPLSRLLKEKSRLDVEEAVGYVLQAARGLKYAHDQNMIHRDIKPENLLLNNQGIVKVADLGLVKTPEVAAAEEEAASAPRTSSVTIPAAASSQITLANVAMGTPAFMAPEQARDAANVDVRADIYSLGCTLYDLVTGKPPFEGKTAIEVLSKHQSEPITPPDMVVKRVPKTLSEIILKMTAKRPEDRYRTLDEVIRALEGFLGVSSAGPFTPREEHARLLEENAQKFAAAPAARVRRMVLLGGLAGALGLMAICLLARLPILAGGLLGLSVMTALAYFIINGIRKQTYLFNKTRELIFASPISDWLMVLAGLLIAGIVLFVFKLFWVWVIFGVVAVLLALAVHFGLDRKAEAERAVPLENVETMLRSLRLHGLDEDALRLFVCKYSGDRWEELFEELFGYEAKRFARDRWGRGERARPRPKYAAWRDPVVDWIDAKIRERREQKERAKLQKIEEKGLQALGENLVVARRKAKRAAEAMVTLASEMKHAQEQTRRSDTIPVNHDMARALRNAARKPEDVLVERESGLVGDDRRGGFLRLVLSMVLGPRPRFLAGALLIAGSALWIHQNELVTTEQMRGVAREAVSAAREGDLGAAADIAKRATEEAKKVRARAAKQVHRKPLVLPMLPAPLATILSTFGAGFGGLILLVSSFFRGVKMTLFAVPAAAIAVIGSLQSLPLPRIPNVDPSFAPCVVATAVLIAGILFGRSRE